MANSEKVLGFRFDEDILNKLQFLMEEDEKEAERMGVKPKTRKEFFEEGIRLLYFRKIRDSQDTDVVGRLDEMIDDSVNTAVGNLSKRIDRILFLAMKNDLGNKVLYRSPSVLPAPDDVTQAVRIIVNEDSRWNTALETYMKDRWTREFVHREKEDEE